MHAVGDAVSRARADLPREQTLTLNKDHVNVKSTLWDL